ncbi:hypothetical protein TWF694_000149 [Orbilia ellipsospora]|uniref:Uncharacterized protein n=1 Tax=Orbilia ellipsospora TaxID=2528407 RepID=A0AAV9XPC1_9PEZI
MNAGRSSQDTTKIVEGSPSRAGPSKGSKIHDFAKEYAAGDDNVEGDTLRDVDGVTIPSPEDTSMPTVPGWPPSMPHGAPLRGDTMADSQRSGLLDLKDILLELGCERDEIARLLCLVYALMSVGKDK